MPSNEMVLAPGVVKWKRWGFKDSDDGVKQ